MISLDNATIFQIDSIAMPIFVIQAVIGMVNFLHKVTIPQFTLNNIDRLHYLQHHKDSSNTPKNLHDETPFIWLILPSIKEDDKFAKKRSPEYNSELLLGTS
jgi:hypothetical protein|nr:MAG TPA: hypothetical protein [Siphoviridae sp. ct7JV2]